MIESIPLDSRTAALLLAGLAVVATALVGQRRRLGPAADWVEVVRAACLPVLDPIVERYVGGTGTAYTLEPTEYVGHVPRDSEAVEAVLWGLGCRRNPVAAFKTNADGDGEVGSWVYRGEDLAADRQLHLMLFDGAGGGTDLYAHCEFSSSLAWLREDPSVLLRHYQGVDYSPAEGIEHAIGLTWGEFGGAFELSEQAKGVLRDVPAPEG